MAAVELREIRHSFAGHPVLRGLTLSIDPGQYVVLLGASGCGKTTTLKVIAGLQSPDQGTVLFDGRSVDGVAPRNRDVSMVFQHDGLYPHLTVDQSIRFALRGRIPAEEIRERVGEAIELTQISSILDRYPSGLSGGELRRAAIAKAIARRTSVRLLDEPLSALDAPLRYSLQDDILRWHTTVPGTTIHVTHDGQEALRMADTIAVMEAGQLIQIGTPDEVLMRPQTVSVAEAIGSPPINLLRASIEGGKIVCPDSAVSFSAGFASDAGFRSDPANGDLILGVRPDAFRIADSDGGAQGTGDRDGILVRGELLRARQLQRDTHVHLRSGNSQILAIIPSESWTKHFDHANQAVQLFVARKDLHLFSASSRRRIDPGHASE